MSRLSTLGRSYLVECVCLEYMSWSFHLNLIDMKSEITVLSTVYGFKNHVK